MNAGVIDKGVQGLGIRLVRGLRPGLFPCLKYFMLQRRCQSFLSYEECSD